jgi:hypothetical protein
MSELTFIGLDVHARSTFPPVIMTVVEAWRRRLPRSATETADDVCFRS